VAETEAGATGTQADPGTQPPAGSPGAQAASGTDQPPESISLDEAKKLRAENQSLRQRAKGLEEEKAKLQQASMSETEKRDQRLAELERREADWERERQDWQTRDVVTQTALRLGYADPADAYSLIDRAALEFDDSGKPRNVDKLLADLIAAKPYLAGASRPGGSFDGGPRGAAAAGTNMNDLIRRQAGH